ncbi:MAG: hypothetical protein M3O41_00500 [Pseudomonadota bacterium]|nr:hypothetical protein [Pseudomonadota bacterium]
MTTTLNSNVTEADVNKWLGTPRNYAMILRHMNSSEWTPELAQFFLKSGDHSFIGRLHSSMRHWGRLTDGQRKAVERIMANPQKETPPRPVVNNPWPEGKGSYVLSLKTIGTRLRYSDYAAEPTLKALAEVTAPAEHAGARVWLTMPKPVIDYWLAQGGTVKNMADITFSCTIEVWGNQKDAGFGIGRLPHAVTEVNGHALKPEA